MKVARYLIFLVLTTFSYILVFWILDIYLNNTVFIAEGFFMYYLYIVLYLLVVVVIAFIGTISTTLAYKLNSFNQTGLLIPQMIIYFIAIGFIIVYYKVFLKPTSFRSIVTYLQFFFLAYYLSEAVKNTWKVAAK